MFDIMLEQLAGTPTGPNQISWPPSMPGLRVCAFDCAPPKEPLALQLAQEHYETLFCLKGEVHIEMEDGRSLRAAGRDILLLSDPGQVQEARVFGERFCGVLVSADGPAARESLRQLRSLLGSPELDIKRVGALMRSYNGCTAIQNGVWNDAVFSVLEGMPDRERGHYCILKAAELLFLLSGRRLPLARNTQQDRCDPYQMEQIQKIHDYMCSHLNEPLTIQGLARQFHLSPTLLKNYFRQIHGKPLHSYLQECRLRQAAQMLTTTALSVAGVAEQTGYHSTSQFGAAFKRRYGLSPLQYRLAARTKSKTDEFMSETEKTGEPDVL